MPLCEVPRRARPHLVVQSVQYSLSPNSVTENGWESSLTLSITTRRPEPSTFCAEICGRSLLASVQYTT